MYSIYWEQLKSVQNILQVRVTLLDQDGSVSQVTKTYQDWIGVCTNNIDKVIRVIRENFPNHVVSYVHFGEAKKVLPYFDERLERKKI